MNPQRPNLVGKTFGRFTVVEEAGRNKYSGVVWKCKCSCGAEKLLTTNVINCSNVVSCGCWKKEVLLSKALEARAKTQTTHGDTGSIEYNTWNSMLRRCSPTARNRERSRYFNRGITVCERWHKYENFLADMGRRPSKEHSIDRIDNDKGYFPENCRWATNKEQQRNTSYNHRLEFNGENLTIVEWAERTKLSWDLIHGRITHGWTAERALTTPKNAHIKK